MQLLLNGGQLGGTRLLQAATVRDVERSHTGNVRARLQTSTNPNLSKDFPVGAGAGRERGRPIHHSHSSAPFFHS